MEKRTPTTQETSRQSAVPSFSRNSPVLRLTLILVDGTPTTTDSSAAAWSTSLGAIEVSHSLTGRSTHPKGAQEELGCHQGSARSPLQSWSQSAVARAVKNSGAVERWRIRGRGRWKKKGRRVGGWVARGRSRARIHLHDPPTPAMSSSTHRYRRRISPLPPVMATALLLVAGGSLLSCGSAATSTKVTEPLVPLDTATLTTNMRHWTTDYAVMFYAPWCQHCK